MTTPVTINKADPGTIVVGPQLIQVCPSLGPGQNVVVFNNDIVNVLYVGYRTAGLGITNTVPIQPLTSATLDASRVMYGFCPTATIQITVAPAGTIINPSPAQMAVQIAEQLALGGIPLLHGIDNIVMGQIINVGAGSSNTSGAPRFLDKPGIMGSIFATQAAAATIPFLQVTLRWYEATGVNIIYREDWFMPTCTGVGGNTGINFNAPVRGAFYQFTFTNLDPAQSATVNLSILSSTHHVARSDWRSGSLLSVPGTDTYAVGALPTANILVNDNVSVAGATVFTWQLPLYSGQVLLSWTFGAAVSVQITSAFSVPGFGGLPQLMNIYQSASLVSLQQQPVTLPRVPATMTLTISGANTGNISMIALEYAS